VAGKGTWLCTKAAVPLPRGAGGGSIVNMASEVALSGSSGLVHYVTSKAAIIGLTRALARELGPSQIRATDESTFVTGQTLLVNRGRLNH
jgi:NAD(P)-dependent dehydrogenase (short-subunit alcohol dehydrogenase family)